MKRNILSQPATLFVVIAFSLFSCEDGIAPSNRPPFANAGIDLTIMLPDEKVNLDGSASHDPEGPIVTFVWRKISGAGVSFADSRSAKTTATRLSPGIYQFELKVTDHGG